MPVYLKSSSQNTVPRIFRREITGKFQPSDEDKEKLESTSFIKTLDLISDGPIEGFCDNTGGLCTGSHILKGVYLNNVPIQVTNNQHPPQYNFRNVSLAFKKGIEDQSPLYQQQKDNFYWLEDFSYSSMTSPWGVRLFNQTKLEDRQGAVSVPQKQSQGAYSVIDQDVDWLAVTVNVGSCYTIDDDGVYQINRGTVHLQGDFTGVYHRSKNEVLVVPDDSRNDHNVFVEFEGLATSAYKEDIFLKLKDVKDLGGTRPRNIIITNTTQESYDFKTKFEVSADQVTEIVDKNFSYPHSAIIASVISAENFSNMPSRSFDMKLKKVKVPSNYVEKEIGGNGPTQIRSHDYIDENGAFYKKGTRHDTEERHEGFWDGTFKDELQWTDNPAWILYDLITSDRYGLSEYLTDIKVDKWELYKIAKHCDELVNTSKPVKGSTKEFKKERRYSCNILLNNAADAYQTIRELSSIFRGIAYFNNSEIFFSANQLKESITSFTNDGVIGGAFRYSGTSKSTKFTAVKVAFKDKDDGFQSKYEYIEDPEGIIRYGLLVKEITAIGCTSRDQALRLGRWTLLTSTLEEEQVSFVTDSQAEFIEPGSVFTIYDELRTGHKVAGRVKHIKNDADIIKDNFILLDQRINIDEFEYTSLSFVIPSKDYEDENVHPYKEFVHRNGYNLGEPDGGERQEAIPLNSTSSKNEDIHGYLENTESGCKVITDRDEDLILRDPTLYPDAFMEEGAGIKTLNDYLLEPEVLKNLTNGDIRSRNEQKIKPGSFYIFHGISKEKGEDVLAHAKEYTLLSKSMNDDGTYSMVAQEYNRDKFDKTDSLSTIYKSTTFDYDTGDTDPGATDDDEIPDRVLPPATQVFNPGYPKINTVDLIVSTTGIVTALGESRAVARYYFHNTMENAAYYQEGKTKSPRYEIRCQEISQDYYTSMLASQDAKNINVVQNGQWVLKENGRCGDYKVLYDNSLGEDVRYTIRSGNATVNGTENKPLSVVNFNEQEFNPFVNIIRPRNPIEFRDVDLIGCAVYGKEYEARTTGNVLSGEFELPDPEAYYELRWLEANSHGTTPEKIMFFKGSRDEIPPSPVNNFEININELFPNFLNFRWQHQGAKDPDLAGFRIYTGHIDGDNEDYEFTNLSDVETRNTHPLPKDGSHFAEVMGKNASYFTYEADTRNGTIRDNNGNQISFNDTGVFHIRAFDYSENLSDPANSNLLTLFQFAQAPDLYLSGEIREEGIGTDTYGQYPVLHAFYSGDFHTQNSFTKYSLQILDETNGFGVPIEYNISREGVKIADSRYGAQTSGHYEIKNVLPSTTYLGRLSAISTDGRSSPEGQSRATIGKDEFPPAKLKNFRVDKQFSNFRFSWDEPLEKDCKNILLYTGVGSDNFQIAKKDEDKTIKLTNLPKSPHFASALPDDSPAFRVDKFKDADNPQNEEFKFHAVPVDTSSNTGMYSDFIYKYVDLNGPQLHTSGQLTDDGRSLIHVFYSGVGQSDESFNYYLTQYQDTQDIAIQSFQGFDKAQYLTEEDRVNVGQIHGKGSGHFSFEARGNRFYEIRSKMVFDAFESRWSNDIALTPSKDGYIKAFPDEVPPGRPTWISASKNGNNVFLSWENPKDKDLLAINLYTGTQKSTEEDDGTLIHQRALLTSQVIPLKDFSANINKNFYFYLQAVDTSLNTGAFSAVRQLNVGRTRQLNPEEIIINSGIFLDENGDGSSKPYIEYKILDNPLNYQHAYYKVDLATNPSYNPLVETQTVEVDHGVADNLNTGSGIFTSLNANERYYLRARIHEFDGKYSQYTNAFDNPILTPKDNIPPKNPENFYIVSGPKQAILEWDWSAGVSSDIASVLVYKTGIPTGRINTTSNQSTNCWKTQDISGYFEDNPEEYTYKLNPSTSYIDGDIETGIGFPGRDDPKQTVYYHYLLKTVDRSNNTGINFVSGKSRDPHNYYWVNKAKTIKATLANSKYDTVPHYHGYITGGAISADYITNIYAGRILTDKLTTTDLILSHPSGRILSDNVHTMGSNNHEYDYAKGAGVYIDHKMFRIGNPEPGGAGIFWTGEKLDNGEFKKPTFNKNSDGFHGIDIVPNTLEIRGNMTAGTIQIGSSANSALNVDSEGNLTIGNQSKSIKGFFNGTAKVSGIMGQTPSYITQADPDAVYVQLDDVGLTNIQKAELNALQNGGGFLETNWIRGPYRGWEVRAIESVNISTQAARKYVVKLGVPFSAYVGYNFYDIQGNTYGLSGVVSTGSQDYYSSSDAPNSSLIGFPKVRDWWRIHQAKFKVTNDGTLFAADARILGTAKADSLEVNKTIVLGDTYNQYTSIIQSYGFEDGDPCAGVNPSGWKIVGDGHAIFKSIDIRSGVISGSVGLQIGKQCDDTFAFRANQFGEIGVGRTNVLHRNNFYVSKQGNITAADAVLTGDLSVSGGIDVGDGILLGTTVQRDTYGNVTKATRSSTDGILITQSDIRNLNFSDGFGGGQGFKITNKGKAIFHNLSVTGGWLSGVSMIMGGGTETNPWFKAFYNGEISVGSYGTKKDGDPNGNMTAGTAPSNADPFYVSKKGALWANNAYIKGTISGSAGLIGSLYIGQDYVSTYNDGSSAKIRTSNELQKIDSKKALNAGNYRTGLFLGKDGRFSITNEKGKLIGWNGSNRYITVTGIASSFASNADYTTEGTDSSKPNFEVGQGFYLQGDRGGSYISNFDTDTKSAKNIAHKVITHINGDIQSPIINKKYTILCNSQIGYTVKSVFLQGDAGVGTCEINLSSANYTKTAEGLKNTSNNGTYNISKAGTKTNCAANQSVVPNSESKGYIVIKPTDIGGNTSIRFRIDLIRSNAYA